MRKYLTLMCCVLCLTGMCGIEKSSLGTKGIEFIDGDGEPPLPDGAVPVEYLESTGKQWVITDTVITSTDDVEIEYSNVTALQMTGRYLQGWSGSGISYWGANNGYYDRLGNKSSIPLGVGDRVSLFRSGISGDKDYVYVNDTLIFSYAGAKIAGTLTVFAYNTSGYGKGPWRIGRIMVRLNGEVTAEYIPCRVDGVGYFYNRISGEFFGATGTEPLIIGSDVN